MPMDEIALLERLDDDVAVVDPATRQSAHAALRTHIATTARPNGSQRRVRTPRRLGARWSMRPTAIAAMATLVVVIVIAGVVLPGRVDRAAHAATPPLLLPIDDSGIAAQPVLQRLATAAERQPPLADGRYRYHRTANWYLQTTVYDAETASSVVVPAISEWWMSPDGSGVLIEAKGELVDARPPGPDGDRRAVDELPDGDAETTTFEPGELSFEDTKSLPRDSAALRRVLLASNDGEVSEHVVLFVALQNLVEQQRLEPDLLATFYRMLADEPDLRSFGPVTDRAGRDGIAIGFDSDYGGLPARYLLIVDPDTGTPLGSEEILTTDPGKLNVDVPAVIGYAVYLAGGNVDEPHQRGSRIP